MRIFRANLVLALLHAMVRDQSQPHISRLITDRDSAIFLFYSGVARGVSGVSVNPLWNPPRYATGPNKKVKESKQDLIRYKSSIVTNESLASIQNGLTFIKKPVQILDSDFLLLRSQYV